MKKVAIFDERPEKKDFMESSTTKAAGHHFSEMMTSGFSRVCGQSQIKFTIPSKQSHRPASPLGTSDLFYL
ncbi:hypothetical protein ACQRBK_06415 [Peptoniphilaceae bacterium SGI.137]